MNRRLEMDIIESKGDVCVYVSSCPLLRTSSMHGNEEISDRYELVCSTDGKYNCPQFVSMGGRR